MKKEMNKAITYPTLPIDAMEKFTFSLNVCLESKLFSIGCRNTTNKMAEVCIPQELVKESISKPMKKAIIRIVERGRVLIRNKRKM